MICISAWVCESHDARKATAVNAVKKNMYLKIYAEGYKERRRNNTYERFLGKVVMSQRYVM
jgi:hypothetical protein